MLNLGILLLVLALALWTSMIAYTILKPKLTRREGLSGGLSPLTRYEEEWSRSMRKAHTREAIKDWDIKLIKKISLRGEASLEDIVVALGEITPVVAERIKRLEARGYVARTPSGSYIITEEGRKFLEKIKEKQWYRRKEREILENV